MSPKSALYCTKRWPYLWFGSQSIIKFRHRFLRCALTLGLSISPSLSAYATTPHIAVFGDSTIQGWTGKEVARTPAPAALARELGDVQVENWGVSGEKLSEVVPKWAALLAKTDASIVVVNWGLNDALECDAALYEKNLRWLVANTPRKLILETPNFVSGNAVMVLERRACLTHLVQIMRSVAKEKHLMLIDVYQYSKKLIQNDATLLPDGVHPSQALYNKIGQYMAQSLRPLLKKSSAKVR